MTTLPKALDLGAVTIEGFEDLSFTFGEGGEVFHASRLL
jgi:hypothetical protein